MPVKHRDPLGLKAKLDAVGATQGDLAEFMRVNYDVVHRIVSGSRKKLSGEEERKITEFFSTWGNAEGRAELGGLMPLDISLQPNRSAQIPLYGFAAAGPDSAVNLNHEAIVDQVDRHPAQNGRRDAFAVEVWGESMSPRYYPGERVYCLHSKWPAPGQDCLVELLSGDVYLKQYVGMRDGAIQTHQYNPEQQRTFLRKDVKALHAVVR